MYYVVGLGNPGEEYVSTRHNVGWLVLDMIAEAEKLSRPVFSAKYQSRVTEGVLAGQSVLLAWPDTYMNHSGVAVKRMVSQAETAQLIVLYDDVALPLGEIKISTDRGHGGHNGVRSIIEQLERKDFIRIRIGIAQKSLFTGTIKRPTGEKLPKFVLGAFTKKELAQVEVVADIAHRALDTILKKGVAAAMNVYN